MADIVTIKHVSLHGAIEKFAFECLRDGRLSGPGQPSEPNDCASMPASCSPLCGCDFSFRPKNVFAFGDRTICVNAAKDSTAATNFAVIKNDKPAEIGNAIVVIDHQRGAGLDRRSEEHTPELQSRLHL